MKKDSLDETVDPKNLGLSLTESLDKSGLKDRGVDFLEVGLDSVLKEGVLKDIPILGALVSISKAAISVKDMLFLRKIWRFLQNVDDIQEKDRTKFISELSSEEKQNLGEKILLLLDRHENFYKSELLAKITAAYIQKEIQKETFDRLCNALDRLFIDDLSTLKRLDEKIHYPDRFWNHPKDRDLATNNEPLEKLQSLYLSGLVQQTFGETRFDGQVPVRYQISDLGKKFVSIIYDIPPKAKSRRFRQLNDIL
ncbi:MAG: hypothetical protein HGB11_12540 [Chlorobiales bacterium]|nr:hypothetical protein [Chlorobiales bacterium]